jgi:hypothetical protein
MSGPHRQSTDSAMSHLLLWVDPLDVSAGHSVFPLTPPFLPQSLRIRR